MPLACPNLHRYTFRRFLGNAPYRCLPHDPVPDPFHEATAVYAVIRDRGRQSSVRVGDLLECDLNDDWKEGDSVTFDEVLVLSNEGEVKVGTPCVDGASVTAEVLGLAKGPKEVVFRFKRRKNVRVKKGRRQSYTRVRITKIEA